MPPTLLSRQVLRECCVVTAVAVTPESNHSIFQGERQRSWLEEARLGIFWCAKSSIGPTKVPNPSLNRVWKSASAPGTSLTVCRAICTCEVLLTSLASIAMVDAAFRASSKLRSSKNPGLHGSVVGTTNQQVPQQWGKASHRDRKCLPSFAVPLRTGWRVRCPGGFTYENETAPP